MPASVVSIHAPWEGCDLSRTWIAAFASSFQFTHPGKGATRCTTHKTYQVCEFQFTHPGKGATVSTAPSPHTRSVSIHAPWEGCDTSAAFSSSRIKGFNSRTLGRVRLNSVDSTYRASSFNSRTLGRVRLLLTLTITTTMARFNSRTLGRVRLFASSPFPTSVLFQFTHPGKGATGVVTQVSDLTCVSIHAPWEGCDISSFRLFARPLMFQFTHPGKGATSVIEVLRAMPGCFNSRTLGRVRHGLQIDKTKRPRRFNSRTLGRVRLLTKISVWLIHTVSIHAPWEGCDLLVAERSNTFFRFNSRTLGRVRLPQL